MSARCSLTRAAPLALLLLLAAGCAVAPRREGPGPAILPAPGHAGPQGFVNPRSYVVDHHRYYVLSSAAGFVQRGIASWYGTGFHSEWTADGERYNMFALTAAHKTLPIPCYVRVTDLDNGRSVVVRVNDRGPFVPGRIIDLSYAAAARLDMLRAGTAPVKIVALTPGIPPIHAALPVATDIASSTMIGPSAIPALAEASPDAASPAGRPHVAGATAKADESSPGPARPALFVQVGAFADPANAQREARALRAAGLSDVLTLAPTPGRRLQRVRIGPLATRQQARALIVRLAHLGFPGAQTTQQ